MHTALRLVLLLLVAGCSSAPMVGRFRITDRKLPHHEAKVGPVLAAGKAVRFTSPVDLALVPGTEADPVLAVVEQRGDLRWVRLRDGARGRWLRLRPVGTYMEEGLLGFAFHPGFPDDPRVFTYHTDPRGPSTTSVVTEWTLTGSSAEDRRLGSPREILRVPQPQEGHHAGQLAFGPDGMLYVGFGDGGFQRDPGNRAQDPTLLQGKMLRIDVDHRDQGRSYGIPADNPFVGVGPYAPEVWATGFRNPWRYAFAPDGRLVVADVGQGDWEEIDIVERGGNYGWSLKEGRHCFSPQRKRPGSCEDPTLIDPIWEYGRMDGAAVIGGTFWTGNSGTPLDGRFVFGDTVSGRIWALALPTQGSSGPADVLTLGQFDAAWTSFGRGIGGEVWAAAMDGRILRIVP